MIHLMKILISAFFYIIPIFMVFIFIKKKPFRQSVAFYFLFFTLLFFTLSRIVAFCFFNQLTGRYLLPMVLVASCLIPIGIFNISYLIQKLVESKLKWQIAIHHCVIVLMIITLTVSGFKAFRIHKKIYLVSFAKELKKYNLKNAILIDAVGSGERIAEHVTNKLKVIHIDNKPNSSDYWVDFLDKINYSPLKYNNIFILTKSSIKEDKDSFHQLISNYYGFSPFELLKLASYRKRKYRLYKFNYKIYDGVLPAPSMVNKNPTGLTCPQQIEFNKKELDLKFFINDFVKLDRPFYWKFNNTKSYGRTFNKFWQYRLKKCKKIDISGNVIIRNQLFWPIAYATLNIDNLGDKKKEIKNIIFTHNEKNNVNLADFHPVVNLPKTIYILPGTQTIYASNFNVLYNEFRYNNLFTVNGEEVNSDSLTIQVKNNQKLSLEIKDKIIGNSTKVTTVIKSVKRKDIYKKYDLNILLIDEPIFKYKTVAPLLVKKLKKYNINANIVSLIDYIGKKQKFAYYKLAKLDTIIKNVKIDGKSLCLSDFDYIIINCGNNDLYAASIKWLIPDENCKIVQQLKLTIKCLKDLAPSISIGITLPIVPAPGHTYYYNKSWFRMRMAHKVLCDLIYNCFEQETNIGIIPLYHNIDPRKDYQATPKNIRDKGIKYWYPLGLNSLGVNKVVDSMTAWLLYSISKNKFPKEIH